MGPFTTKSIVSAAILGNALAAVGKVIAYALTGSSALLSEAIHSLVAVAHQTLVLFGIEQAKRPADARHAFGYARELYFWSYIAAILLFSHGAGFAIYEGIQKIKAAPFLNLSATSYAALLVALVIQAGVAILLTRDNSFSATLASSREPARAALGIETAAAIAGSLIALAGLIATDEFGFRYGDATASLGIGFVMAAVATLMCLRIRGLIVGEAASPALRSRLRGLVQAEVGPGRPLIAVRDVRTMHLGPDDILVAVSVAFKDGETAQSVQETTERLEQSIKGYAPEVRHVFVSAQSREAADDVEDDLVQSDLDVKEEIDAVLSEAHPQSWTAPAPAAPKAPVHPAGTSRKARKKKRRH